MRILHIVTLITPDGAYGGPARVALNQASALVALGHEVVVAAGYSGYATPPESIGAVPTRLFRAHTAVPGVGYAGVAAPAMTRWLSGNAADFDIAHVHLARDLVAIPAANRLRRNRIPFVVQPHGMITPDSHPLASTVDRLWTTRLLRSADNVLHLNDREAADLTAVGGPGLVLTQLDNGVPTEGTGAAHAPGTLPEVLFMARLHPRKRPETFARVAVELLRGGVRARFTLVGPAEGAESEVDAILRAARDDGFGPDVLRRDPAIAPGEVPQRMAQAAVYVLPARLEPFGMTIVEALAQGVPVVIGGDGGLAEFVTRHECGTVVDGSVDSYVSAVGEMLAEPERAALMGQRGRAAVSSELSIGRVGAELAAIYSSVVAGTLGAPT
jgi:glycosyltransferase involved in cell wall biosynthesis